MKNNIIDYPGLIKPMVLTPEKKKYIDAMNQYITELRKNMIKCTKECENCIFHIFGNTECNFTECVKLTEEEYHENIICG